MENKEKVYNRIRTKWIETKNSRLNFFDISITDFAKELDLSVSDLKNILDELKLENKIRFTSNKGEREASHKADLPNKVTVLDVNV